jgi:hypothetical protein
VLLFLSISRITRFVFTNYSNKYFVANERELIQSKLNHTKNRCSPKQILTRSSMVELQRSNCVTTEVNRLRGLPNEILYTILHVLLQKDVVYTKHISTLYKAMWIEVLAASTVIDFTNRDFGDDNDQMLAWATAMMTMCVCVCVSCGLRIEER